MWLLSVIFSSADDTTNVIHSKFGENSFKLKRKFSFYVKLDCFQTCPKLGLPIFWDPEKYCLIIIVWCVSKWKYRQINYSDHLTQFYKLAQAETDHKHHQLPPITPALAINWAINYYWQVSSSRDISLVPGYLQDTRLLTWRTQIHVWWCDQWQYDTQTRVQSPDRSQSCLHCPGPVLCVPQWLC